MENNKDYIISIENIMSDGFSKYAKYIIQDRALPDARDGLKPVQRRIIFAMNNLNLLSSLPHKKSARTVGEVIGKYHPHGDSSIYDAMVRLSQSWKNNLCLLNMHGNNGSIDGDSPAAMRYTECRLSSFGELMINDIKKETVDFIFNFDDSEKEPVVLPTIYPNLLINGANGIAAGYATNIPPFNPKEVVDAIIVKIDSPNCHLKTITDLMPGPDFPTGGIISNTEGILDAYKTGKGKITVSSKMQKINSKQIAITSIPFETNKSEIVKAIEQARIKTESLGITEVRDESDGNGINIVLDVKPNSNFDLIKNYLYKTTKLQINYHFNMIAIKDRKPVLFDIFNFLQTFIDHAENVILKSSIFDLNKAKTRKEIVDGLIKAISMIDDVIYQIKKAKDKASAIENLMLNFSFSQVQAEAIVNLRLYRLTNADVITLKQELDQLNLQIVELTNLVENKNVRLLHLKTKLREFKKTFGYERKTEISDEVAQTQVIDELDLIESKEMIFTVTKKGYLKSFSNKAFLANDMKDNLTKKDDLIVNTYVANLRDRSILFLDNGQALIIPNNKIPDCKVKDIGTHTNNIITYDPNASVITVINANLKDTNSEQKVLICTKNGHIKICLLSEIVSKRVASISYAKLNDGDKVVSVVTLPNDSKDVVICSKNGFINRYGLDQIPTISKNAAGVKAMSLKDDDKIANCFVVDQTNDQIAVITNYAIKKILLADIQVGNRTNKGKSISNFIASNNNLNVIKIISMNSKTQLIYLDSSAQNYISASEINYLSPTTKIYAASSSIIDATVLKANLE